MNNLRASLHIFLASVFGASAFASIFFSTPVSAQDLNTDIAVDGTNVHIILIPLDYSCQKNAPIQLGRLFCIRVVPQTTDQLWLNDFKVVRFDAVMPEHRHGMVTRAIVKAEAKHEYLIKGVKLHMPGNWEFKLDLMHGKSTAQVAIPMKL